MLNINEGQIPPEERLPRYTAATWRYEGGALGTLTHAIALHGNMYETSLEIIADGALLRLEDPYGVPKLHVRLSKDIVEDIEYHEVVTSCDYPGHASFSCLTRTIRIRLR
jgi:hypothetical protein